MCIEKWKSGGIEEPRRWSESGIFYCFSSRHLRRPGFSPGRKEEKSQDLTRLLSVQHCHGWPAILSPCQLLYNPSSPASVLLLPLFPILPKSSSLGLQCRLTLCFSALHHSLLSQTSFSSSLTHVRPHQSFAPERVSAHINPSPPLTHCIVKHREIQRESEWQHVTFSSTGERGLEVCCHGDRSPLPVDLCVCVRVRHNGHVPAAAIPELHSQDHHPLSRLTVPQPQTHWQTAPPTNQHSRTRGSHGGAALGFIVSVNWNQNWNSTAITPIIFIVTFFEMNSNLSCMKKKGKHRHTSLQFFCPDV